MDGTIYERIAEWLERGASLGDVEAMLERRSEEGDDDARSARWLEDWHALGKPEGDAADRLAEIDRRSFG